MPVDASLARDAAAARDARPDQRGIDRSIDESRTDASTADAKDGPGGLPCLKAWWDGSSNNPDVCRNEVGVASVLVTGTCGAYHVVENATNGDDEVFYYFDASGALVAIADLSGGQYRCSAGLVAVIDPPCIYLNSPSVTRLYCRADGGPTDRPLP